MVRVRFMIILASTSAAVAGSSGYISARASRRALISSSKDIRSAAMITRCTASADRYQVSYMEFSSSSQFPWARSQAFSRSSSSAAISSKYWVSCMVMVWFSH